MAEERPAFLCYAKEWIAATRGLPLAARGAYWDLLCFAWLDGSVTADLDDLRLQVGAEKADWKRIWPKLAPKWTERDGRLYNDRLEEVRAEADAFTAAKSAAGRASAKARRERYGSAQPPNSVPNSTPNSGPNKTATAPEPASASASAVTDTPRVDDYLDDPGALPTRRRNAHCSWESARGLDVPTKLHDELRGRLAQPDDMVLFRWYAETENAWKGRAVGDDCWTFWRARFREWQGTTVKPLALAPPPNRPELRDLRAQVEAEAEERALATQERAARALRKASSGPQERRTDVRPSREAGATIVVLPVAGVAR